MIRRTRDAPLPPLVEPAHAYPPCMFCGDHRRLSFDGITIIRACRLAMIARRRLNRCRPRPTAAMTGQILLAWLKLLALDGDLAEAEPKTLRRLLHTAARLARGGRRRRLKIQATWPWAQAITTAWQRIDALPHPP